MKRLISSILFACSLTASAWDLPAVHGTPVPGDFALAEKGSAAPVIIDPREPKVVLFAAEQLRTDIAEVTGADSRKSPSGGIAVIVGSIGSPLVNEAAAAGG